VATPDFLKDMDSVIRITSLDEKLDLRHGPQAAIAGPVPASMDSRKVRVPIPGG